MAMISKKEEKAIILYFLLVLWDGADKLAQPLEEVSPLMINNDHHILSLISTKNKKNNLIIQNSKVICNIRP